MRLEFDQLTFLGLGEGLFMNGKMFGCCGALCYECPVFLAMQKNDDKERERLALLWSGVLNMDLKKENINCAGCLSEEGPRCCYCNVCEVRLCAVGKGFKSCSYCADFPCQKLTEAKQLCLLRGINCPSSKGSV